MRPCTTRARRWWEAVVTVRFDLEIAKVAAAAFLLLAIAGIMLYYLQVKSGTVSVQSDRLVIVSPSELFVDKEAVVTIKAVDGKGSLMESRKDLIEVWLSAGNASVGARGGSKIIWSQKLTLRLEGGIAEILIKGRSVEMVTLTARQVNGGTKLKEAIVTLGIGYVG